MAADAGVHGVWGRGDRGGWEAWRLGRSEGGWGVEFIEEHDSVVARTFFTERKLRQVVESRIPKLRSRRSGRW